MATAKKTAPKQTLIDDEKIITAYMEDVLENSGEPSNVYVFCKRNQIEESQFYTFFNSFQTLRQQIWVRFFENAETIIRKEPAYASYSDKDKLLTLYFTLFEILTLNRTYVAYSLRDNKQGLQNLKDLKLFRRHFTDFITQLLKSAAPNRPEKIGRITEPVMAEGAWIQFLFILKFWLDDASRGFEKTDIIIEKSVTTVVGLLDTKPLENLIDLGKFLWKERN
jgi:hypothetical protein